MQAPPDPLAQLRDIHLPPPPSFWPPAPGWWFLVLIVLAIIGVAILLIRRHRANAAIRDALSHLTRIQQKIDQEGINTERLCELSILMRRIALSCYPREQVAGITGDAWLIFLDQTGQTTAFTKGIGRTLSDAPYNQVSLPPSAKALPALIKLWIIKQKKNRRLFSQHRDQRHTHPEHARELA